MRFARFRILLLAYATLFALLAGFTAMDYGLSWDEPYRWGSGDRKLAYYQQLFRADGAGSVRADDDVYPGLYDLPLAWARQALSQADPIALSRAWNAVFALALALVPVALTRLLVLARRRPEDSPPSWTDDLLPFAAGGLLLLMPEVFGHLFLNPKDIPFAATYGWGVVALVALLQQAPGLPWPRLAAFGVATGLAMASRPPGLVLICYFGLFAALWTALPMRKAKLRERLRQLYAFAKKGVAALLIATAVLLPFWPKAQQDLLSPFEAPVESVGRLQSFSSDKPVLYAGQFYSAGDTPRSYVPWMFAIKQPEWILLLLLAGAGLLASRAKRAWQAFADGDDEAWGTSIVAFAALFPAAFVLATGSAIHNGFRHMLYILPSVAVLAALSWRALLDRLWPVPRWRYAFLALSAACALFSASVLARLHPYQYVYYNALVGGPAGAYGRYESDYWFVTGQEGVAILRSALEKDAGRSPAKVYTQGPASVVEAYLAPAQSVTRDIREADFYIGRPIPEIEKAGRLLGYVERMGMPLLSVVDLRSANATP